MRLIVAAMTFLAVNSIGLNPTQAALAPKFERARQLSEALKRLVEVTRTLADPIDKIEYLENGAVRFTAGKCALSVNLRAKLLTQRELETGASPDYMSEIGPVLCGP